jgi:hypothetical protein
MKAYKTKISIFSGTDFREVHKKSLILYREIKKKSKRRPYIRSVYFKKQKIFLELFWYHLYEKSNFRDKVRRLKYFPCAIDLLQNSRYEPVSKENLNRTNEILHRFAGITKNNEIFLVHVKENKQRNEKWLMSVFPLGNKKKKTFR